MRIKLLIKKLILKILGVFPYKISISSNIEYLKQNGLKVGNNFSMMQGCIIDDSHCWLITIGDNVTLAPNVHILAHDASTKPIVGYTRIATTTIGNNVFIGAGSIILPGITIGDNVVIGAGTIVTKDIESNSVFAGNRIICSYSEYCSLTQERFASCSKEGSVYEKEYTILYNPTQEMKNEMKCYHRGFVI